MRYLFEFRHPPQTPRVGLKGAVRVVGGSEGPEVPRTIRAAQPREEADHPGGGFLAVCGCGDVIHLP
jgi:hypothetical protein